MKRNGLLILMILAICNSVWAQEKKLVMKGNELYQQKKYKEAQAAYQQALQKNPAYVPGAFNLGNTLIQQQQYDAARKVMANTAKTAREKDQQAGANYNIGNTYMSEQKWNEAIEAYKQALRKNPQDEDAKYNLSYALTKMKQDQQKNKDKNKDQKDNKDKKDQQDKNKQDNKDKKDQDKNGNQQQPQDNKDGKDKEDKRPEPQPGKLSQQQADNILKALQQEERKLQEKKQQEKGVPVKVDKDW